MCKIKIDNIKNEVLIYKKFIYRISTISNL